MSTQTSELKIMEESDWDTAYSDLDQSEHILVGVFNFTLSHNKEALELECQDVLGCYRRIYPRCYIHSIFKTANAQDGYCFVIATNE